MAEVKCWAFGIPNLPLIPNRRIKKFINYVSNLDGFVGLHPSYPDGTALVFNTENNAKRGRNLVVCYEGYDSPCGNVVECFVDEKYIHQAPESTTQWYEQELIDNLKTDLSHYKSECSQLNAKVKLLERQLFDSELLVKSYVDKLDSQKSEADKTIKALNKEVNSLEHRLIEMEQGWQGGGNND